MTILEKIIASKKDELALMREQITISDFEQSNLFSRKTLSLREFLADPSKTGIIAEFKRRSPSKGVINSVSGVGEVTRGYTRAGASGLSVLTDRNYLAVVAVTLLSPAGLIPSRSFARILLLMNYRLSNQKLQEQMQFY
jgi:indole-3-glycerol phosphate synthase